MIEREKKKTAIKIATIIKFESAYARIMGVFDRCLCTAILPVTVLLKASVG